MGENQDRQALDQSDKEAEDARRMGADIDVPKDSEQESEQISEEDDSDKKASDDEEDDSDEEEKPASNKEDDDDDSEDDEDASDAEDEDEEDDSESESPERKNDRGSERFADRRDKRIDRVTSEFNAKLDKLSTKISDALDKFSGASSSAKQDEATGAVDKAIKTYLEKNNLDEKEAEQLKQLIGVVEIALGSKFTIPKEVQQKLDIATSIADERNEKVYFTQEWTELTDDLADLFPNATKSQMKEAKTLMDKLSHSRKYGFVPGEHEALPLDYILYKEKKKFEDVLTNPRKRTGERSNFGTDSKQDEVDEEDEFDEENMTPEKAEKLERKFRQAADKESGKGTLVNRMTESGNIEQVRV